jgi:Arc/MetJ-type ribon-helix-helix transcriptional regulator
MTVAGYREYMYNLYMSQMNLQLTPEFERNLRRFMRLRRLQNKSEAIRLAVQEALERSLGPARQVDYAQWLGAANQSALNPHPRFASHDDLWR